MTKVLTNREFSKNLEKRTLKFGLEIIRLSTSLPNTPEARVIRNQITKSGTSIGANIEAIARAEDRKLFPKGVQQGGIHNTDQGKRPEVRKWKRW